MDKYEGARIPFRPEKKSYLSLLVKIKNIVKHSLSSNRAQMNPIEINQNTL